MIINTAKNINWRVAFMVTIADKEYDLSEYIKDITLPNLSFSPVDSSYGPAQRRGKLPADTATISDINVEFLLDDDYTIMKLIYQWAFDNMVNKGNYGVITVQALDSYQSPVYELNMSGVFPININAITLSTGMDNMEIPFGCAFEVNNVTYTDV